MVELNIAAIISDVAGSLGDQTCIMFRERNLSWTDFADRSLRFASVLTSAGLGNVTERSQLAGHESGQDHVGIYLYNGNEYLEAMIGAYAARTVPINVNYRYQADELVYLLADSSCRALVYHAEFAPQVEAIIDRLDHLTLLIQVADDSGNALVNGAVDYEEALRCHRGVIDAATRAAWSGTDLYACYTGGTTGMPKGVLWQQSDFLTSALGVRRRDGDPFESMGELVEAAAGSRLRALPAPPLMHGAAHWNALSCLIAGGSVIIQDHPERLDPADILDSADRHGATSLLIVGDPFALPIIAEQRRHPRALSALRHILSGGAVLGPETKNALLELFPGVKIIDVLGSTESGRQGIARSSGDATTTAPFAPSPHAVVLNDQKTATLAPGSDEVGWLAQGGPVPLGYLNDPKKSAATFPTIDGQRFSVAGDRATLDSVGRIVLLGRESATINTGGEKVFAEEVETIIKTHPAIHDAVVCGRPSERWGHEVVAVVSVKDGHEAVTLSQLRSHAKAHLAAFKAPRGLVIVEQVQRSPSGKADYRWAHEMVSLGPVLDDT